MTNVVNENIEFFLRNGHLINIQVGISRNELTKKLGDTNWIYPEQQYPLLYKYGCLEFHFDEENDNAKLVGIMYVAVTEPASNGNLMFDAQGWTNGLTTRNIEDRLKNMSVNYTSNIYEYDSDAWCILTEGNVSILCSKENEGYLLEKLGVFI